MRVTSNGFSNSLVGQLNQLMERQHRLQNQAATGQKITLPEDNPGAMKRVLDAQTESRTVAQYQSNIARLKETAATTFTSLQGLKTIGDRAGEIAVLADGLKSPAELSAYASEVGNLIKQAVQLANTKDRGNYIFGGTRTDVPPYAATTDADNKVTAVTYQGDSEVSESEIAENATAAMQSVGSNTTGSGPRGVISDARSGSDFLNHLISLQNNLLAGNTAAIATDDKPRLAKDEENILHHISANGVFQSRLDTTASLASKREFTLKERVSAEVDADLAETFVQLSQAQTAYQAALQSGAQLMGRSLLDYLR